MNLHNANKSRVRFNFNFKLIEKGAAADRPEERVEGWFEIKISLANVNLNVSEKGWSNLGAPCCNCDGVRNGPGSTA